MLYHLLPQYADSFFIFNVFRYNTFRAAGAVVTSLVLVFLLGPSVIRWLTRVRFGQVVRQEGPASHLAKAGTPTMGGVLIILAAAVSTLLWARLDVWYTGICLAALLWMGAIGFLDDYLKVVRGHSAGLVARYKMAGQWAFGLSLGAFLVLNPISPLPGSWTSLPFFSDYLLALTPLVFVPFVGLVVSGSSNAVNLTDGLDGLAAGLAAIAAATFAIFAYLSGHTELSAYLGILYLPTVGEMAIFAVALAGASVGFLWFNAHPADVFMGDTGS
ncbi:MAG TPA: phospho-N-acetylmuramoyl-pentapeptide-transferase, partial [Longimicrobiales bacterium]